jgi:hypothetical protein
VPTRTGLDELKASSVVWVTAVNDEAPQLADPVYLSKQVYRRDNQHAHSTVHSGGVHTSTHRSGLGVKDKEL